jgi:predicted ArsR family transcriptional regulator
MPRTKRKTFLNHCHQLDDNGVSNSASLTHLLLRLKVLDVDGNFYPPTKEALLEVLKWHADNEPVTALPMDRLAMEMGCKVAVVRSLFKELEDAGLIRRHRSKAPGNLYVTEVEFTVPEVSQETLTPVQAQLLEFLKSRMSSDGIVQTNEYEMAAALGVSRDSAVQTLLALKRLGYVSATIAEYGRPYVIKVYRREESQNETEDLSEPLPPAG